MASRIVINQRSLLLRMRHNKLAVMLALILIVVSVISVWSILHENILNFS